MVFVPEDIFLETHYASGLSSLGVSGVPNLLRIRPVVPGGAKPITHQACHPWGCHGILADQLSNPISTIGADYAHQIILAPPDFQIFLRPCALRHPTERLKVLRPSITIYILFLPWYRIRSLWFRKLMHTYSK